jgi:heme-degrading monooxygenase HmoA
VVARVIRFEGSTQAVEEHQARAYQELLPALEEMEGFRGLIFLGAPEREAALALALWANAEAADASSEAGRALREGTTEGGESVASVELYEVMLFEV